MRRWHWLAGFAVVVAVVTGCWVLMDRFAGRIELQPRAAVAPQDDGNAEASDVIEPLVVDGGMPAIIETREPPIGPPTRVVFEPGMQQPPRPDANPDRQVLMPYADE